ncbi:MAG: polysaccharide biosynthesis protein, partial [Nitrospinota bacterium]
VDMAKDMIRMSGFIPEEEVKIEFTGLRSGDKLYEELLMDDTGKKTRYESITITSIANANWEEFEHNIDKLLRFSQEGNVDASIHMLKRLVPEFNPQNDLYKEVLANPFDVKAASSKTLLDNVSFDRF